jgi:NAD(P)H-hydrate epimerase
MVIDADGLKALAKMDNWWEGLPEICVLTPHPGEFSVLTGLGVEEIQADRTRLAIEAAARWKCVVVLKGAFTVVADPSGKCAVMPLATPALARAGTGDVLAGIITGLLAQGLSGFDAACCGVWVHGQAGLLAKEITGSSAGVLAGDLIDVLPEIMPF